MSYTKLCVFRSVAFDLLALSFIYLCLRTERCRVQSHVLLKWAMLAEVLDISTIDSDIAGSTLLEVFFTAKGSEAPVLGNDDLLPTGELVHGAAESFDGCGAVCDPYD